MPVDLPELDDRTYADLVEEALGLIPAQAPEWTNHNPSDPGITLIESFAYLTEMLIYRLNRVSDDNLRAFLRLIKPDWVQTKEHLTEEVHELIRALRQPDRAVSEADFEHLARAAADRQVARARCFADPNTGRVRVIVVPRTSDGQAYVAPSPELLGEVEKYLEPRRLLTTSLQVEGPRFCPVGVRITLVLEADAIEKTVHAKAIDALTRFLDPVRGGIDGLGWPFGRNVYVSEIYDLLDRQPGVDYVKATTDGKNQPLDELTVPEDKKARLKYEGRYDLRLMSVAAADGLVNEGRNLVIVALVGTDLHIRIFDASGKKVVDKAEKELVGGSTLTALKKQLSSLPDGSDLSIEHKQKIIGDATSIAGQRRLEGVLIKSDELVEAKMDLTDIKIWKEK